MLPVVMFLYVALNAGAFIPCCPTYPALHSSHIPDMPALVIVECLILLGQTLQVIVVDLGGTASPLILRGVRDPEILLVVYQLLLRVVEHEVLELSVVCSGVCGRVKHPLLIVLLQSLVSLVMGSSQLRIPTLYWSLFVSLNIDWLFCYWWSFSLILKDWVTHRLVEVRLFHDVLVSCLKVGLCLAIRGNCLIHDRSHIEVGEGIRLFKHIISLLSNRFLSVQSDLTISAFNGFISFPKTWVWRFPGLIKNGCHFMSQRACRRKLVLLLRDSLLFVPEFLQCFLFGFT